MISRHESEPTPATTASATCETIDTEAGDDVAGDDVVWLETLCP